MTEKSYPTKEDLDEASTKHPIVIVHTSDHINAGNSLAFKLAGFKRSDIGEDGVYVRDGQALHRRPYGKKSRWMGFYRCLRRNRSDGPSERGNTE